MIGPPGLCGPRRELMATSGNELTLPCLKARGFLIQRLTIKSYVLSAILKPFNRRILPINEPDSQPPQRVYLQKRTRIFTSEFGYALPYLTKRKLLFFFWFSDLIQSLLYSEFSLLFVPRFTPKSVSHFLFHEGVAS